MKHRYGFRFIVTVVALLSLCGLLLTACQGIVNSSDSTPTVVVQKTATPTPIPSVVVPGPTVLGGAPVCGNDIKRNDNLESTHQPQVFGGSLACQVIMHLPQGTSFPDDKQQGPQNIDALHVVNSKVITTSKPIKVAGNGFTQLTVEIRYIAQDTSFPVGTLVNAAFYNDNTSLLFYFNMFSSAFSITYTLS